MDAIQTVQSAVTEAEIKAALNIAKNFIELETTAGGRAFRAKIVETRDALAHAVLRDDSLNLGDRECLRSKFRALENLLDAQQAEFDAAIFLLHQHGELPGYMAPYVKPMPPPTVVPMNQEEIHPFSSDFRFRPAPQSPPPTK